MPPTTPSPLAQHARVSNPVRSQRGLYGRPVHVNVGGYAPENLVDINRLLSLRYPEIILKFRQALWAYKDTLALVEGLPHAQRDSAGSALLIALRSARLIPCILDIAAIKYIYTMPENTVRALL